MCEAWSVAAAASVPALAHASRLSFYNLRFRYRSGLNGIGLGGLFSPTPQSSIHSSLLLPDELWNAKKGAASLFAVLACRPLTTRLLPQVGRHVDTICFEITLLRSFEAQSTKKCGAKKIEKRHYELGTSSTAQRHIHCSRLCRTEMQFPLWPRAWLAVQQRQLFHTLLFSLLVYIGQLNASVAYFLCTTGKYCSRY